MKGSWILHHSVGIISSPTSEVLKKDSHFVILSLLNCIQSNQSKLPAKQLSRNIYSGIFWKCHFLFDKVFARQPSFRPKQLWNQPQATHMTFWGQLQLVPVRRGQCTSLSKWWYNKIIRPFTFYIILQYSWTVCLAFLSSRAIFFWYRHPASAAFDEPHIQIAIWSKHLRLALPPLPWCNPDRQGT